MKTLIITFVAIFFSAIAFGQKVSNPPVKVSAFARYANVATLQKKELGHFQANLVGMAVSRGRFGVSVAYLHNHATKRHGYVVSGSVVVWKTLLSKEKGIGMAIKSYAEIAHFPSGAVPVKIQAAGGLVGIQKTFEGRFSIGVAVPLLATRTRVADLPASWGFQGRVVLGASYAF